MRLKFFRSKQDKEPDLESTDDDRLDARTRSDLRTRREIEPDNLQVAGEIDTSTWPPAINYSPEQPTTDIFLGNIRLTDEHLDIKVGKGKFIRRWRIHKALICRYSGYFRQACHPSAIANASFQEGNEGIFDLHDDNPAAFELFADWLYSNKDEPKNEAYCEASKWALYSVEAYALGDKLMADDFRPFALKEAIDSARLFDRRDIEIVFELTGPHDPLYRFTCRWVSWRCREDPWLWSDSRDEVLQTERQRHQPATSLAGKDPRDFVLQHWFEPCCEVTRTCEHEPNISALSFYNNEDTRRIGKARLRRAWARREVYGYRHQIMRILAAYGLYVDPSAPVS